MRRFIDRFEAGRELAPLLQSFAHRSDVTVVGLPRGGVPVAFEVAEALDVPLDVITARKLGLPDNEMQAIGAVAMGGVTVIDWRTADALAISDRALEALITRERDALERHDRVYRSERGPLTVAGRTVIVVDDGVATGATMHAAIAALRAMEPARIIAAVPVSSRDGEATVRGFADLCVCGFVPTRLYSVGLWYEDFLPTTDTDVLKLLSRRSPGLSVSRRAETPTAALAIA